jgi:uncharacterized protein (UPF0305 family)
MHFISKIIIVIIMTNSISSFEHSNFHQQQYDKREIVDNFVFRLLKRMEQQESNQISSEKMERNEKEEEDEEEVKEGEF